jgi:hypothetical protein
MCARSLATLPARGKSTINQLLELYPEDDNVSGGGKVDFVGTWSSYALFKSGYILVNTMERGAFILKMQAGATA